jgi:hypothetical protein
MSDSGGSSANIVKSKIVGDYSPPAVSSELNDVRISHAQIIFPGFNDE